jgi:hypothetical protein
MRRPEQGTARCCFSACDAVDMRAATCLCARPTCSASGERTTVTADILCNAWGSYQQPVDSCGDDYSRGNRLSLDPGLSAWA